MNIRYGNRKRQRGHTIMEVLVASVVLSIGLLGVAGLQLSGLQANHSAYHRTLATYQAWDIADRIRANSVGMEGGAYDNLSGTPASPPGCINTTGGCTSSTDLAVDDLFAWNDDTPGSGGNGDILPGGTGVVCRSNNPVLANGDNPATFIANSSCGVNPADEVFTVVIWWTDDRAAGSPQRSFMTSFVP